MSTLTHNATIQYVNGTFKCPAAEPGICVRGRPLPFPPLSFLFLPSPALPFLSSHLPSLLDPSAFPLKVAPFKQAKMSGECCKLPSGIRGGATAENKFGAL